MEQVVAMEGDYQAGELFTGDISQIMGIEEEVNDMSVNHKNSTWRRSQSFNHCYKCGKIRPFQKDCLGDGDEENIEPQHKTVTHTIEAQTPVTDKSLSDFMYKNFKQTEKLKKKYTATKSKLKRTKQELDEVRSKKYESVHTTSDNTTPKKTVTFAKNTMPKKASMETKPSTKGMARSKSSKSLTTTTTTTSLNPKVKVKTEPVSTIETDDTSDDDGGADTENVTEIDTEESSSSSLTESDSDE